jgi:hypothetical protein
LAAAPFASGVPTVRLCDNCVAGLHDGNARGGPCVRFGAVQAVLAGTSDTRTGLAAFGRTCEPSAMGAIIITAAAPSATASETLKVLFPIRHPSQLPPETRRDAR